MDVRERDAESTGGIIGADCIGGLLYRGPLRGVDLIGCLLDRISEARERVVLGGDVARASGGVAFRKLGVILGLLIPAARAQHSTWTCQQAATCQGLAVTCSALAIQVLDSLE